MAIVFWCITIWIQNRGVGCSQNNQEPFMIMVLEDVIYPWPTLDSSLIIKPDLMYK